MTDTLSRYIFSKALFMCLFAWVSLSLLVLVSVFFGNLGTFAEYDAPGSVIAGYMLFSLPQIVHWVLPFSVCVGIIAAQAAFSRHVETIAMQACSVTFMRIAMPYLAVGAIAVLVMSILSFSLYPTAQRVADKIESVSIKKRGIEGSFSVNGGRFKVGGDIYHVEHTDISRGVIQRVTCYRLKSGKIERIIRTDKATWDGRSWNAETLETLDVSPEGIRIERKSGALPLRQPPADLVVAQPGADVLTLKELVEYRRHLRNEAIRSVSLDTQIHARISFALAPIIMTLLVLPFGLRFPRAGGIARGISIGIVLGLAYWAVHSVMTGAGMSGYLHPAIAAWSADLISLGAGVALMTTRRGTYG